ncbi:SpoIIE family protein phosphatase [Streptomyces sp. NPDC090306]|uniref:SpoIIE family protein phosphatase n=1 Tax=Streptomyces sp. NPDC090306 TaxID=3365961 RepID=UPI0038137212
MAENALPDEAAGPPWLPTALLDARVGVYAVDSRGNLVWANPRALELLGRVEDEVFGEDAHDLLHRDAEGRPVDRNTCVLSRVPESRGESPVGHAWFPRGDGSVVPVRWFALPLSPGRSDVAALIAFDPAEPADIAPPRKTGTGARTLSRGERLALLADTTAQLIYSIDVQEFLDGVVRLLLPRLADWAVIDLITEADAVTRSLVVHADNGTLTAHHELQGPLPPVAESSTMPLSKALRGAAAALIGPETYDVPPDTGIAVEQRKLFRATGIRSAAVAPLRGPREVLGAITLGRTDADEPFTPRDLNLLEDIARRIGIALENARHHQRQRQVAETMQRYLLPQLPQLPGVEMTARYLAAPDASDVGGDWYDAFTLPGHDTALVIGDVVGHDLQAAAGMAQLRNMLRAYAWSQDQPPGQVVQRLDQAMAHITDVRMATLILARLSLDADGGWTLCWTNAGHLPPLLVEPGGAASHLGDGHGLLLGLASHRVRTDARIALPPGSTLVLYTDGLVESRSTPLDVSLARMRDHAAALAHESLPDFADGLLKRTRPDDNGDDAALLALRIPAPREHRDRTCA